MVNNLVAWAFTTGQVLLKSDGTPWWPIVHVQDISLAFLAALRAPRELVHNEAFNVGRNEENYRIREIADIVAEVVPDCRVEFAEGAGPDTRCYRVDCSKIARVLPEFQPEWTVRRGAVELYEAYQRTGLALGDFEGDRFSRIKYLQSLLASKRLDSEWRWQVPADDALSLTAAGSEAAFRSRRRRGQGRVAQGASNAQLAARGLPPPEASWSRALFVTIRRYGWTMLRSWFSVGIRAELTC